MNQLLDCSWSSILPSETLFYGLMCLSWPKKDRNSPGGKISWSDLPCSTAALRDAESSQRRAKFHLQLPALALTHFNIPTPHHTDCECVCFRVLVWRPWAWGPLVWKNERQQKEKKEKPWTDKKLFHQQEQAVLNISLLRFAASDVCIVSDRR